ncbi:MAG: hypothetical protein DHS20C16_12780 [Phycisphaerae bacterium]|nr:MAG: hypothetical protein DHS20C16_12780 [Phycisphaerae bacterium]
MSAAYALMVLCCLTEVGAPTVGYFASGDTAIVSIDSPDGGEIAVGGLDDQHIETLVVKNGKVRFQVPRIRSRTVFDLRNRRQASAIIAQVVAYPCGQRMWSDEKIEICALGAPQWFLQWASVVGIELSVYQSVESLVRSSSKVDGDRLVLLGDESGVDDPVACLEIAQRCSANILVLDATWFEKNDGKSATLKIEHLPDAFKRLEEWNWRELPRFITSWRPQLFWSNRAVIAKTDDRVLIEMYMKPGLPNFVVGSFVPWAEQIGKSDVADAFLAALMLSTSRAKPVESLSGRLVVHPDATRWPDKNRPVLSNAMSVESLRQPAKMIHVVDVRGTQETSLSAKQINQVLDLANDQYVLVLGDDPVLEFVRGLPQRDGKPAKQSDTMWMTADSLPAKPADQEALMRVLTSLTLPMIPTLEPVR